MSADPLQHAVAGLWTLLRERKVDFVLVGGIALLQYVAGRNTEDIDLIVPESALERLPEIHITDRNAYFALGTLGDLRIDLWLTANPLFAAVQQQHSTPRKFAGDTIPTATVEGLLLLKLYALPSLYRGGDFARVSLYENDIAALVQAYRPAAGPLLEQLAQHLSRTDLAEVECILGDIQRRIERFDAARNDRPAP
jgi:hypothetical protein